MPRREKRKLIAEINVVPYIDVTLVLLIVFMASVPLVMQGVDVDLPKAPAQKIDPGQLEPLIVSVNQQGEFFVNLGADPERAIDSQQLAETVQKVLKATPETPVMVWGDKRVNYGAVVNVMALLQAAGAPSVGLVTEPGREPAGS